MTRLRDYLSPDFSLAERLTREVDYISLLRLMLFRKKVPLMTMTACFDRQKCVNPSCPDPEQREEIKLNFTGTKEKCGNETLIFILIQLSKMHGKGRVKPYFQLGLLAEISPFHLPRVRSKVCGCAERKVLVPLNEATNWTIPSSSFSFFKDTPKFTYQNSNHKFYWDKKIPRLTDPSLECLIFAEAIFSSKF